MSVEVLLALGSLPGIDQVLGQADAGRGPGYGDLAVSGPLHWVGNLDLSAGHLTDLIDLRSLAANNAANQLESGRGGKTAR